MATHSSTLAWKIPWTEEPCKLQSMGSQRVGHDWATSLHFFSSIWLSAAPFWTLEHCVFIDESSLGIGIRLQSMGLQRVNSVTTTKAKGECMFIMNFFFSLPSHPDIKVPRGQGFLGFFFSILFPKDDLVTFRSEQGEVSNVYEWSQGVGQVACNFPTTQREFFSCEFPGSPSAYPRLDSHRGIYFCFSRLTIPFPLTPPFYKWCWHSFHSPVPTVLGDVLCGEISSWTTLSI